MSPPRLAVVGGTAQVRRGVMADCPDCSAALAVMRIIGGRGGAEYWTLRCVSCGGIHLDIVKGSPPA